MASGSYTAQRALAGILALPLTTFALLVIRTQLRTGFDPMGAVFGAGAATAAILGWWFALRGHVALSRTRMLYAVTGGFVVGAIGFAAGFFLPLLLTPSANQGPLLGIFVTGPLGLVLGTALGWLYARLRTRGPGPG